MSQAKLYIMPLVYKRDGNVWLPSGQNLQISCNCTTLGVWGINLNGEEVPVQGTTIPPLSATPGNSYQSANALVQVGGIWVNPAMFGDSGFKMVVKVKDLDSNIVSYVDVTSWTTEFVKCNFVPEPTGCNIPTSISAGTPATTSATITYVPMPGSVGIEYVNNTSSVAPVVDGTYVDAGTTSVAVTGLTAATTYHFWVRTICGAGSRSAWTSLVYTTHA